MKKVLRFIFIGWPEFHDEESALASDLAYVFGYEKTKND